MYVLQILTLSAEVKKGTGLFKRVRLLTKNSILFCFAIEAVYICEQNVGSISVTEGKIAKQEAQTS